MWLAAVLILMAGAAFAFVREKRRRRTHPVAGGLRADVTLPHDQEFELYGNAFSHCSRKARLVLAELGIPYRHRHVDLIETGSYGTIAPEYLRINPAGLIPVLLHGGHPVYESDEILAYAARVAGPDAPPLTPREDAGRAEMAWWIDYCSLSSSDPMGGAAERLGACIPGLTLPLFAAMIRHVPAHRIAVGLLFHFDRKRPAFFLLARLLGMRLVMRLPPIAALIEAGRAPMRGHLERVEATLRDNAGPWLLGAQFTLADISLACALLRLEETGWLARFAAGGGLDATLAYYGRVRARPSWRAAIEDMRHPLVERGVADLRASALIVAEKG
ncbi:glutathione S-transferase family protein [Zavarzinia compransoris]|uniref:glutathione S-transferase family protein n=1 Tax=Zavarzinia marina TaxID=2911065 RepID=UPI001F24F8E5|nr:glutathione S-transferase family protein [Zavarzinia marina]MCF4164903.1 glutathione S-transferase family protein [Zavarzinia marina]